MRTALLLLAFLLFAIAAVLFVLEKGFGFALVSGGLCAWVATLAFKLSDS